MLGPGCLVCCQISVPRIYLHAFQSVWTERMGYGICKIILDRHHAAIWVHLCSSIYYKEGFVVFAVSHLRSIQGPELFSFEGPFISPYFQIQHSSYCVQWENTLHSGPSPNCRCGEHDLLSIEGNEADWSLSQCDSKRIPHCGDLRLSKWPLNALSSKRVTVNHLLKWCGPETSRLLLSWLGFPSSLPLALTCHCPLLPRLLGFKRFWPRWKF